MSKILNLMPKIKVVRPRMRQTFSYKITGDGGLYYNHAAEPFDTEAQAEKHARTTCAAFAKLGKMPRQVMIESRLVPAKHIEQAPGVHLDLVRSL